VQTFSEQKGSPTVLVLDDEPSMRVVLARLLRLHGFNPLDAAAVADATATAQREDIHGFIVDLKLDQGQSGLDLVDWLRVQRKYSMTPVFILTGNLDLAEAEQARIRRHRAYVFYKGQSLQLLMDYLKRLLIDANPH
jgi:DNA-binding response OmpR family regulator